MDSFFSDNIFIVIIIIIYLILKPSQDTYKRRCICNHMSYIHTNTIEMDFYK